MRKQQLASYSDEKNVSKCFDILNKYIKQYIANYYFQEKILPLLANSENNLAAVSIRK